MSPIGNSQNGEFTTAHCHPPVTEVVQIANLQNGAFEAAHSRPPALSYCSLLCVTPPFLDFPLYCNNIKGGIVSGSAAIAAARRSLEPVKSTVYPNFNSVLLFLLDPF